MMHFESEQNAFKKTTIDELTMNFATHCNKCNTYLPESELLDEDDGIHCGIICINCAKTINSDKCIKCGVVGQNRRYDRHCGKGYCEKCSKENRPKDNTVWNWPECAHCERDNLCELCVAEYLPNISHDGDYYCFCKLCINEYLEYAKMSAQY